MVEAAPNTNVEPPLGATVLAPKLNPPDGVLALLLLEVPNWNPEGMLVLPALPKLKPPVPEVPGVPEDPNKPLVLPTSKYNNL